MLPSIAVAGGRDQLCVTKKSVLDVKQPGGWWFQYLFMILASSNTHAGNSTTVSSVNVPFPLVFGNPTAG